MDKQTLEKQTLEKLKLQEAALTFTHFDADLAWQIGYRIRELAVSRGQTVAIEIGLTGQDLFYCAMPGTAPDHKEWLRRKRNTVQRYHKSSYRVGIELRQQQTTLTEKTGLPLCDYACHGGCVPIHIKGAGQSHSIVVGTIAVSGLPERADHELAIEAIAAVIGLDYQSLALD